MSVKAPDPTYLGAAGWNAQGNANNGTVSGLTAQQAAGQPLAYPQVMNVISTSWQ
jgi:hypothetical protein